jgi:eukaryotic-like serine/threonine-protein kinase
MEKGNFWKFIISKEFLKLLQYALAVFFGIILFVNIGLKIFTLHNRTIEVPSFKGLTFKEAQELAADHHIKCEINDSSFVAIQKPGTIIEQNPKAGFKVKKNRRIFLVINATNPEKVKMPNLVGVSLRQAMAILESNGLNIGTLRYVPDIADNNVLNQRFKGRNIAPDVDIVKGSRIDLVLGKSSSGESTTVPDLTGKDIADARKAIAESFLNTGAIFYDESIQSKVDSLNAKVYKQKPEASNNNYREMGSFVDIWLTIDESKINKTTTKNEE